MTLIEKPSNSSHADLEPTDPAEQVMLTRAARLAEECAKLDPDEERTIAEEGLEGDVEGWPGYW